MSNALFNVFVTAIMFIAFLGQGMAFNSSFSVDSSNKSANQQSHISSLPMSAVSRSAIDNHEHKTLTINKGNNQATSDCIDIDCCATDCCDIDCVCAAGGCSSLMYLNNELVTAALSLVKESSAWLLPKQVKTIIADPYRPPILQS